ncbi:MAG: hypothetical protein SGI72_18410 [Planctomycetota bacterium]|nr:hypothetical protein [Planctomycetota bacterium]
MDKVLVVLAALFVLAAFIAVVRAIQKWRGPSRWLATFVLVGAFVWALWIVLSIRHDPTSHNLWPMEAIMIAGATLTALVTIAALRPKRAGPPKSA